MISSKDMEVAAAIVRAEKRQELESKQMYVSIASDKGHVLNEEPFSVASRIEDAFVDLFSQLNERFSEGRFRSNCEVE